MTAASSTTATPTTASSTTATPTTASSTTATPTTGEQAPVTGERADLLQLLNTRRHFLRFTLRDMTDEQAAAHPTVSELCLGGLIKHVASTESGWAKFIVEGPSALVGEKDWTEWGEKEWAARAAEFQMLPGETVDGVLADYDEVARHTNELVATLPDLDASHPLPEAPWFEPGARWSARQALLHIAAETAQHAGHADIIRETIDGSKSM